MVLSERTIPRFLFCKNAVLNLFVLQTPPIAPHIAQAPFSSKFLIFFLPSLLHSCPLPPSCFWWVFNCSFVIAGDLVQLLFHHDEFGDCFFCTVGASEPYRMHVQYGLQGTAASVHPLYSTVFTMLVQRFDIVQVASITVSHLFVFRKDHAHLPLGVDICFSFWLWLTLLPCFLYFSLALYKKCNKSSFYFAFCSKRQKPSSFLVITFRWVCQLSGIQTILGNLWEVLSLLSKSNHGVNTSMVCVLVVRSNIDLRFTRYCVLNCCVQPKKVKGFYNFFRGICNNTFFVPLCKNTQWLAIIECRFLL